eukprot:8768087-Pyramimonas_sp.AAC.1
MQARFEDITDYELTKVTRLDTPIARMDLMIGEREGDELSRSGRRALYEATRENRETLTQYVSRREAQFTEAEGHDLWMSDKLK